MPAESDWNDLSGGDDPPTMTGGSSFYGPQKGRGKGKKKTAPWRRKLQPVNVTVKMPREEPEPMQERRPASGSSSPRLSPLAMGLGGAVAGSVVATLAGWSAAWSTGAGLAAGAAVYGISAWLEPSRSRGDRTDAADDAEEVMP